MQNLSLRLARREQWKIRRHMSQELAPWRPTTRNTIFHASRMANRPGEHGLNNSFSIAETIQMNPVGRAENDPVQDPSR